MDDASQTVIVGSGLSGLTAARVLADAGRRVLLLDKGRGVGGRLATRRGDGVRFDHGAQYFTARDPEFRATVAQWRAAGVVTEWSDGFPSPGRAEPKSPEPRYRGTDGMAGIAKHLAAGLTVEQGSRVTRLTPSGPRWHVLTEAGDALKAAAVLLTCPVPQSLEILAASGLTLDADLAADLAKVEYAPCLALMVTLEGPSAVPPPGGIFAESPLSWVADNTQKGVSPGGDGAVTLHADADFSRAHYATPEDEVTRRMLAAGRGYLGGQAVAATALHRWKYSMPTATYPARHAERVGSPAGRLLFAGDAFGGPRVEGAYLSGLSAGRALLHDTSTT